MAVRKTSKYEEYRLYAMHCLKLVAHVIDHEGNF